MVLLQRFWLQLTSDKRRFGLLCVACGMGLLLWARIIIISNLPRTAVADEEQANVASTMKPGGSSISDKHSAQRRQSAPLEIAMWRQVDRDPFAIDSLHFPKSSSFNVEPGEVEKSGSETVENDDHGEAGRVARLQQAVESFSLDAVMLGQPMAIINGKMYRVGAKVPAPGDPSLQFTLVDVGERMAVLEIDDHQFQLKMPTPGPHHRNHQ